MITEKDFLNAVDIIEKYQKQIRNIVVNISDSEPKVQTKCQPAPVELPSMAEINFRSMRKSSGLTLREVRDAIGVSDAYLSQLECGKIRKPSYEVVKVLYEFYSDNRNSKR